MRCFIAVDFPEEVNKEIKEAQSCLLGIPGLSLSKGFHLTLKFLGDIEKFKITQVIDALALIQFPPFDATISKPGFFPSERNPRVVWLAAEGKKFFELNTIIETEMENLKFKKESFTPHITLARVKYLNDKDAIRTAAEKIKTSGLAFRVASFSLKSSVLGPGGPTYSEITKFQLNL